MPKKKSIRHRKRRDPNFVAIPFATQLALATLADNVAVKAAILGAVFTDDFYPISVDCLWDLRDSIAAEAPLQFGFCHGDLSVAELGEALDVALLGKGGIVENERLSRPVRQSGYFQVTGPSSVFNNGNMKRTPIRFKKALGVGQSLDFWVMNRTGNTLTTGAVMEINGLLYGRWS